MGQSASENFGRQTDYGPVSIWRRYGIQPGIRGIIKDPFPFRYPHELEQWFSLRSGRRVLLRPYRSGDEAAYRRLFLKMTPKDVWFRYFSYLKDAPESELMKFRHVNYASDLKFIANAVDRGKSPETIGIIGLSFDIRRSIAEFALIVRSDQKRQGLGRIMLNKVTGYARCQGYKRLVAEVLRTNFAMLNLSTALGFEHHHVPGDDEVTIYNEFVIVFNDLVTPGDADRAVQRFLADFEGPFDLNGRNVALRACAGISLCPANGDTAEELMSQADKARRELDMKAAIGHRFIGADINRAASDRLALAQSMHDALEQRQLQVFYLPQYDVMTETLNGVEALLKWRHPQLGLLPASRWVPLADELNIIRDISRFVLERVAADDAAWQEMGARPVDLMINFYTSECLAHDFVKTIFQVVQTEGVPCHRLIFEFAEDCTGYHATDAWQSLTQLARKGIRINIDNYGRGYTNVMQLKTWPLDRIKIDRALIAGIVTDDANCAAVKALIDLGHALDLKVAANDAETPDHLTVLKHMGCDLVQGFALSEPGNPAQIGELMLARS